MLRLVTTDFDGTLVGYHSGHTCVESLSLALKQLEHDGILWAISTGRTLLGLLEGLEFLKAPIEPNYIMTNERHIYYRDAAGGWQPFADWNETCDRLHQELFQNSGLFFEEIKMLMLSYHGAVELLEERNGIPEGLVTDTEELLDELVIRLMQLPHRPTSFFFQRSHTYLRFCHSDYHKGRSLEELSHFLSLTPHNILTIGDHYNDLSMLNSRVATMVACPSNAHHEVKTTVQQAGGHISQYAEGEGTAEAIRYYHNVSKKLHR